MIQISMNRPSPSARPISTADISRRTGRPLFFNGEEAESTDWDLELGGYVEVPLTSQLPSIAPIQGVTYLELRSLFKSRIHRNEKGLEYAYVNKHDAPHMDRVANGVLNIASSLGYSTNETYAATLGARLHDVGYNFPVGTEVADLEKLGKEIHHTHAPDGAKLVTDAIAALRKTNTSVRTELTEWDDDIMHIAHESIALHSNDVGTDKSVSKISLLARLVDKLDNTQIRVRPSHIEAFRMAPHRSIQYIRQLVRNGQKHLLSQERVASHKRHNLSLDDVRNHLHAVDPYYFHRITPYAIQDQRLLVNPETSAMIMDYQVYPGAVGEVLGVEYTPQDHLQDFRAAYTRSMQNAASVIGILQGDSLVTESKLTVRMNYDDNTRHVIEY